MTEIRIEPADRQSIVVQIDDNELLRLTAAAQRAHLSLKEYILWLLDREINSGPGPYVEKG